MRRLYVAALLALMALTLPRAGQAQETSADFSPGSMIVGYDSRTCDSSLEGAIRFYTVPVNGLVGWWKLDETGNTSTATDSAGPTDSSGTLQSFPADPTANWQTGRIGGALRFDGISNRIDYPSDADLQPTSAFTIAAWVNSDNPGSGGMIAKAAASDGFGDGWRMGDEGGASPQFQISVWTDVNQAWDVHTPALSINAGEWHHVVGTYDGSEVKIYVDGVDQTQTSAPLTGNVTYPYPGGETGNIGYSNGAGYWPGKLDDVRLYNRALNATEIDRLYNYTGSDAALQFCDGSAWTNF